MKTHVVTVALLLAATTAFGQGKISMANNDLSPVKMAGYSGMCFPSDVTMLGLPVGNANQLPSGVILVAGLYVGRTINAIELVPRSSGDPRGYLMTDQNQAAGRIPPTFYVVNGIPGGTDVWVQIKVWDAAFLDYSAAYNSAATYAGQSSVFRFTLGSSITYPSISSQLTEPIIVGGIPEPSAAATAALGLVSMLALRRGKTS